MLFYLFISFVVLKFAFLNLIIFSFIYACSSFFVFCELTFLNIITVSSVSINILESCIFQLIIFSGAIISVDFSHFSIL